MERKHKHLLETTWALHFQSKLPVRFWDDCLLTACYLINRFPLVPLNNKTPYEVLLQHKPNFEHLKAFGCLCFASTPQHNISKFHPRATPCVLIGYPFGKKTYKLMNLETRQTFGSRDVTFLIIIYPTIPLTLFHPLIMTTPTFLLLVLLHFRLLISFMTLMKSSLLHHQLLHLLHHHLHFYL